MTYEEFKEELFRNISFQEDKRSFADTGGLGYLGKVVREDYLGIRWTGYSVKYSNSLDVSVLYKRFLADGWRGVMSELWKDKKEFDRQLILRPINYWLNREELDDCIYWRFGDFALALYVQLKGVGNHANMKIRRYMLDRRPVQPEKMLIHGLLNTNLKMPPRLFIAGDIRFTYAWEDGVFMPGEKGIPTTISIEDRDEGIRGYRLTTASMKNGAVAIFYPGVMERLAELLGGDYYVGFTSVHEAVIHPVRHKNPDEMKASIHHINAVFDEKDMLSNQIYRYYHLKRKLLEMQ